MATKKQPITPKKRQPKERSIPVRVLASSRPRRPAPVEAPKLKASIPTRRRLPESAGSPRESDRRMIMWGGVALSAAIIFIVWIIIVRLDLTRPTGADTLFGKLKTGIENILSFGKSKNTNVNAADKELNDIRARVFPAINDSTVTTNSNVNSDHTINTNPTNQNANVSVNTNSQ